jgi:uncharacterized protein (DUF302 family)
MTTDLNPHHEGTMISLGALARRLAATAVLLGAAACGGPEEIASERYEEPDRLFATLDANLAANAELERIVDIDHSRLGAEAGSIMPPARVLLFSDPQLEARLLGIDPLIAIDLPLRVLAYEAGPGEGGSVIFNSFAYLRSRYQLEEMPDLTSRFEADLSAVLGDISPEEIATFDTDSMQPNGIVTLESRFDFATTVERVKGAIDAQDDTVWFGELNFQARAAEQGVEIAPTQLLLFGGPGPGAKAMAKAPTLGLDGFCQKLLVWQKPDGQVLVSFNDLLALADRQGVPKSPPLRVVNRRLQSTFGAALESE